MKVRTRIHNCYRVDSLRKQSKLYKAGYDRASLADPKVVAGWRTPIRALAFLQAKLRPKMEGGTFSYLGCSTERLVSFRAANTQFHSVYFDRFQHGYEPDVCAMLTAFLDDPQSSVKRAFWDVGANWGHFVGYVAALPQFKGSIVAFEPNYQVIGDLRDFVKAAGIENRTEINAYALGDGSAEATLTIPDHFHSGIGELSPLPRRKWGDQRVMVKSADTQSLREPIFVKLDVEGSEASALRGMRATLAETKCPAVFESFYGDDRRSTLEPYAVLADLGYIFFQMCYKVLGTGIERRRPYLDLEFSPLEHDIDNRFALRSKLNVTAIHESARGEFFDRIQSLETRSPIHVSTSHDAE